MNKLLWTIIGIAILSALSYFIHPAFYLVLILVIVALVYPHIRYHLTPQGHRIRHRMLKEYLTNKYGGEGKNIYKDMVSELRRRGYR